MYILYIKQLKKSLFIKIYIYPYKMKASPLTIQKPGYQIKPAVIVNYILNRFTLNLYHSRRVTLEITR